MFSPLPSRHSRIPLVVLALLAVLALIAASCGGDDDDVSAGDDGVAGDDGTGTGDDGTEPDDAVDDIIGTVEWILTSATVDGSPLGLLDSHPVTLRLDGADVGGTAACNSYFGTLIGRGGQLFDGFGVTEMACDPPAAMDLESAFLAALLRTSDAARDGASLVLTGDGVELRFDEIPPTPDADLEATAWTLDTLIDGEAASSIIARPAPTLLLTAGTIEGSDGCNSFSGSYEIDGTDLRVGALASTLRGCEDGIARQAEHVSGVLSATPTVTIDGERLTLAGPDGLALVYRAG